MRKVRGRNHIELILNPFVGDIFNIFDILSIFSYLYESRIMKEDSFLQKFWYRLIKQRWYSISLIPMHIAKGYYYKYSSKEIYNFCKKMIFN